MKNYSLVFLSVVTVASLTFYSCKESITNPEPQPGRRDYVWTVDTLNYPNAPLYRLWANSPTDVWATSPGESGKNINHYDGQKWSSYSVSGMNTPHSVWGENSYNVFVSCLGGEVWKYNGSNWTKFAEITKNGHKNIVFDNIWGKHRNDFYVHGGYPDTIVGGVNNSVIAHFKDSNWEVLNTSSVFGLIERLYQDINTGLVYIQAIKTGNGQFNDSTLIYEYSHDKFKKIYGSIWTGGQQAFLGYINNEVYFILGNRIAKRVNGEFKTIVQIENPNFYQLMWGRSSRDLFFFMTDGLVHYDGSNFKYLLNFNKPRTHIFGAALFEKDVFFLVYESSIKRSLIYHGKIN